MKDKLKQEDIEEDKVAKITLQQREQNHKDEIKVLLDNMEKESQTKLKAVEKKKQT